MRTLQQFDRDQAIERVSKAQDEYNAKLQQTAHLEQIRAISGVEARQRVARETVGLIEQLREVKASFDEMHAAGKLSAEQYEAAARESG